MCQHDLVHTYLKVLHARLSSNVDPFVKAQFLLIILSVTRSNQYSEALFKNILCVFQTFVHKRAAMM